MTLKSRHSFQVIVLGSHGGPIDARTSCYLVRSTASSWSKNSLLAIDAGALASGIIDILTNQLLADPTLVDPALRALYCNLFASRLPQAPQIYRTSGQADTSSTQDDDDNDARLESIFPPAALPFPKPIENTWYIINTLIETICVTHPHLDHIAGLVINSGNFSFESPKTVAGLPSTIDAMASHIFNGVIWPNLTTEGVDPVGLFSLKRLSPERSFFYSHLQPRHKTSALSGAAAASAHGVQHHHHHHPHHHHDHQTHTQHSFSPSYSLAAKHNGISKRPASSGTGSGSSSSSSSSSSSGSSNHSNSSGSAKSPGNDTTQVATPHAPSDDKFGSNEVPTLSELLAENLAVLPFPVSHGTICQSGFARRKSSISGLLTLKAPRQSYIPTSRPPPTPSSNCPNAATVAAAAAQPKISTGPGSSPGVGASSSVPGSPLSLAPPVHPFTASSSSPVFVNSTTKTTYISTAYFVQDTVSKSHILIWGDVEPDSVSLAPRNVHVWKHAALLFARHALAGIFIECSYPFSHGEELFGHFSTPHLIAELVALASLVRDQIKRDGETDGENDNSHKLGSDDSHLENLRGLTVVIVHVKDDDPLELVPPPLSDTSNGTPSVPCPSSTTPSNLILQELVSLAEKAGLECTFKIATPGLCLYL